MARKLIGVLALAMLFTSVPVLANETPEATVARFWQALSHGPAAGGDADTLRALFHANAVVFGARYRDGVAQLSSRPAAAFIDAVAAPDPAPFQECEIWREIHRHDRFATVYSVVESRTEPAQAAPDFTGVNSLQLYRDEQGWKILSLYYHVGKPDMPVPIGRGKSGVCLP